MVFYLFSCNNIDRKRLSICAIYLVIPHYQHLLYLVRGPAKVACDPGQTIFWEGCSKRRVCRVNKCLNFDTMLLLLLVILPLQYWPSDAERPPLYVFEAIEDLRENYGTASGITLLKALG